MTSSKNQPLLTPVIKWFIFTMVLANIAGNMFGMLLPIYLIELGATVSQVGLVFTLSSSVILILQILGGWISDSIGRLRAIAIGSIGGTIGYLLMVLAPSWPWMVGAISISGIAYALVAPSFGAFIAENSAEENRGKVYGITETLFNITGLIGPPLGGFLAGLFGFKIMLLFGTVLYSFAAILRIWMARTMRSAGESPQEKLSINSLRTSLKTLAGLLFGGGVVTWILVTDGVRDVAFQLSSQLQPLYLEQIGGLSLQQIGSLGAIFAGASMISPIVSGRMSDRYGERVPISLGFSLVFMGIVIFLQSDDFIGFALAWAVFGIGVGLLSPAYSSLISKVIPKNRLGIFTGVFRGSIGFISLPAPWLGAQLWERFSPRLPFYITAGVALITIIPTWLKFKITKKSDSEAESASETTETIS